MIYVSIALLRCNLAQEDMYIYSLILTSDFWKYLWYISILDKFFRPM